MAAARSTVAAEHLPATLASETTLRAGGAYPGPGAAHLLALQRTAGNRAVTGLVGHGVRRGAGPRQVLGEPATVQRLTKLAAFDKNVQQNEEQAKQLKAIRTHLGTYHGLTAMADPTFQARLQALRALDTAIHAWFSAHVTGAIADAENGPYLMDLLASSEQEHRKLVAGIAKKPNILPIDTTGMAAEQREQLLLLWRSIVDGTGNLKITSGLLQGTFKDRMLAGLAKLLQTPAGQTLLTEINVAQGDKGKRVELGPGFAKQLKALGRKDPADSQAVPKTQEGDVSSMAYSDDAGATGKVVDYTGPPDPASFHTFLTSLPKGTTHFRFAGIVRKVGAGVGSYVKMAGKGDLHANVGTRGQEVLVPEFITLGHELGHSLRMLKGTTVPFVEDITKLGFAGNASEQRLWNGAEEFVNIMGVENQLRQEHGMEQRVFHAGDRAKIQGPIVRTKIETLVRNMDLGKSHGTQVDRLLKLFGEIVLISDEDARLRKLLSPEVIELVRVLEDAAAAPTSGASSSSSEVGEGEKEGGKEGDKEGGVRSSSSSSSSSEGLGRASALGSPEKIEELREQHEEVRHGSGSSESTGGGGGGGGGGGYAFLASQSRLRADVPIDPLGLGGDGGKAKKGLSPTKPSGRGGYDYLVRTDYGAALEQLGGWLDRNGLRVVRNNGGGRNNCLIISLLQHATRSSAEPKAATVWKYKQQLLTDGVGENDPLLPTDEAFARLLTLINTDHHRNLKAVYLVAFKDQDPPFMLLESAIGTEPVLIWDKLGHFEAVL